MSNELTDVRCPCGAELQADSYDAGFIAGSGMCQNCDAAMPPKDIPAPVEQAGGDERDFQAKGAQEVPSPVSKEYDRHLISLLRKGEALPGHQEEAADEIERLRDWNDHLNNTVLPNILNPNFLMLMKGGERLLDLCTKDGEFIGVSLNDMKDVFDWMVTHARIAPDQAALAQPSPAQAEQAEAERPEQPKRYTADVFYHNHFSTMQMEVVRASDFEAFASKYERIVGELRAVIAQLRQHKNDYMDSGQETYRALQNEIREREAEIARLDGLVSGRTAERDAALARVAELEHSQSFQRDIDYSVLSEYADKHRLHFNNLCAVVRSALITLPAQAQHSVPEEFIGRLSEFLAQRGATGKALLRELRAMLAAAPGKEVGHE
ncbi:hypothetical protein [Pseudomonas aeruginosa]|uniref:hypothetical protein n=1 Tax=Pseudomonas aeruginosa TaxID=287 RepID=UPI0019697955|nr:hypothetical protein [Pseudomonas aeruginosa]